MPAPMDHTSTDALLYKAFFTPVAKQLCFLNPNHVTIANFFLIIPLIYGIVNKWPLLPFMLIVIARTTLDCFDGSIARECKKTSKLGAMLDTLGDSLSLTAVSVALLYITHRAKQLVNYQLYIAVALLAAALVYGNYMIHTDTKFEGIFAVLHDNYFVGNIIIGVLVWFYVNRWISGKR